MVRTKLVTSLLASSALMLAVATPAFADKRDRAQEGIAAAEAKIHTAETIGAGVEVPAATAQARAALAMAKEDLKAGHKSSAIDHSIRAQALADTAIGELQRRKNDSLAAARASERETATVAQDQVAGARQQVDSARQQADAAQQQATDANRRADTAQQAAAASAAEAASARNAAALAAAQPHEPTQVETTVTTQQPRATATPRATTKTRVVKRRTTGVAPAPMTTTTTTTKVTQP